MKHTPGPWKVDGRPWYEALEIHSGSRRIAKMLYCRENEDNETDINARLIAESPELLRLCKLAKKLLEGPKSRPLLYLVEDIDITIARIEGHSHE